MNNQAGQVSEAAQALSEVGAAGHCSTCRRVKVGRQAC